MKYVSFCLVAALAAFVANGPAQAQTAAPVRHLVYSFTYGTSNNTEVHVSGFDDNGGAPGSTGGGAASGMTSYGGGANDKGTITVDVIKEQPDKGLVVNVSEQAQETRSAPVAMCVVYGNTNLICDPNKKVTTEELTLLRFLGSTFIDPSQIDAKQHWQVVQNNPGMAVTADYTILKNDSGKMTVDEVRILKGNGSRPTVVNVNATVGYDFNRTLPTAITEYLIQRTEVGEQYSTIKTETVLNLQSDSLAKT